MLAADPDALLVRLREICLALPETAEKVSHGAQAFHVKGKMFAYFRHNHHGDDLTVVQIKTTGRDEQDMLLEADPDLFVFPPYIGVAGWLSMSVGGDDPVDWDHIAERVRISYRLAAPPRLAALV